MERSVDPAGAGTPGAPTPQETMQSLTRWPLAWRTFAGAILVGQGGAFLVFFLTVSGGRWTWAQRLGILIFVVVIPLICGGSASVLAPLLSRRAPFTQALIMGGASLLGVVAVATVFSVVEWGMRPACPEGPQCGGPLSSVLWAVFLFGIPAYLMGHAGVSLAHWTTTKRGATVVWPLLGLATLATITLLVSAFLSLGR